MTSNYPHPAIDDAKISIWKGQRIYNKDRVEEIVTEVNNYYTETGRFGIDHWHISACQLDCNIYVIDGQHRLKSYRRLMKIYKELLPKIVFTIELVSNEVEIHDSFTRINKVRHIKKAFLEQNEVRKKKLIIRLKPKTPMISKDNSNTSATREEEIAVSTEENNNVRKKGGYKFRRE